MKRSKGRQGWGGTTKKGDEMKTQVSTEESTDSWTNEILSDSITQGEYKHQNRLSYTVRQTFTWKCDDNTLESFIILIIYTGTT